MGTKKYKGKYVSDTDAYPKRVTGVSFLMSPNDIVLSFFDDAPCYPDSYEIEMDDESRIVNITDKNNNQTPVRVVQSRVIIDKEAAVFILKSVLDKLEEEKK